MTLAQAQTLNDALFPEEERKKARNDGRPDIEIKSQLHFETVFEAARREVTITSQGHLDSLAREWFGGKTTP